MLVCSFSCFLPIWLNVQKTGKSPHPQRHQEISKEKHPWEKESKLNWIFFFFLYIYKINLFILVLSEYIGVYQINNFHLTYWRNFSISRFTLHVFFPLSFLNPVYTFFFSILQFEKIKKKGFLHLLFFFFFIIRMSKVWRKSIEFRAS